MVWEQEAADKLGIPWHSRIFAPLDSKVSSVVVPQMSTRIVTDKKSVFKRARDWWWLRREFADWVRGLGSEYDVVLLRYNMANLYQPGLVRDLVKAGKSTYLVHHTKEMNEIAGRRGIKASLKGFLEGLLARRSLRAATGVVAVTNEIAEYEAGRAGLPLVSHCYPNGIRMASDEVADARRDPPEFLFVASDFVGWHGLDLVLDAFEESSEPSVLHLVGRVSKSDSVRARRDSRIYEHGLLNSAEMRDLAARCSVGLGSFALHRKNMNEACTLKVREYLDFGLPVYSGHSDVFPLDFPYYRQGDVCLKTMVDFAEACSSTTRGDVRMAAAPYIDKVSLLKALYESIARDHCASTDPRSFESMASIVSLME